MGKREGKEAAQEGRTKPKRPLLEAQPDSAFARALGSTDFHTREAGLAAVTHWLAKRSDLAELDALKLWKGIFYAYWHSDKSPTALAERLSEIMSQLPEQTGWLYYTTFVRTMRREWAGIDHLRLDKFLMLVRKFFAALLRQLQAHAWQERRVERAADFWRDEILLPTDGLAAAGLAYHLADLLLPELSGCVAEGGPRAAVPDAATLRRLLDPFAAALAGADSPALAHRLRQGLFDPLVAEVRQPSEAAPLRSLDVAAFAAHLFDLGARPDTRARNRVVLYELSAQLEKAAAKRQRRQGEQPEQEQRPPSSTAQRRKGADAEAQQQAQQQADQQQAPAPAPASGKKGKKRRQQEEGGVAEAATPLQERQEQRQQQAAAAAPDSQASPAAAPALPPPSSSKKKAGKKSRLAPADVAAAAQAEDHEAVSAREQELLAAAVAAVTGGGASGFGTPIASASAKKKAVRFSLKRNLVNVIGQPPKPAEVRTPPTSKPKGSALKKESAFEGPASAPERLLTRAGVERLAQFQSYMNVRGAEPGSASRAGQPARGGGGSAKKKQKQQKQRRASAPTPGSFSRPRASEFF